jgi:hypothetical protein
MERQSQIEFEKDRCSGFKEYTFIANKLIFGTPKAELKNILSNGWIFTGYPLDKGLGR